MNSVSKKIITFIGIIILLVILAFFLFKDGINMVKKEAVKKPVIYLYPEDEKVVMVKLQYDGELICTYPEYKNGWKVIAKPDGTLINIEDNMEYSYLFWEGNSRKDFWNDISEGFVVKGEDTKDFLQKKLSEIGLIPKEYNEFIVYWLPYMQDNEYNLIHFASGRYEKLAKLDITPTPDSILRVFMVFKKLDKYVHIEEQTFPEFKREGFTIVEWGGTEIE